METATTLNEDVLRSFESREPELVQNAQYQKHIRPYLSPFLQTLFFKGIGKGVRDDITVVLAHDTAANPEQREAVQMMHSVIEKSLGKSVVLVRASGADMVSAVNEKTVQLQASGKKFAVVVMTGNDTFEKYGSELTAGINGVNSYIKGRFGQDAENLPISAVLNVGERMPVFPLYDVALRLAYNLGEEEILAGLRAVAMNERNMPFTKEDLDECLKRGYIFLRPIKPININEITEASKAEAAVLRAL
jgi:hypothetical protein